MITLCGLPPHGGSGLKCGSVVEVFRGQCLPPHGGSGLKYVDLGDCAVRIGLPPHGGSGLKWKSAQCKKCFDRTI